MKPNAIFLRKNLLDRIDIIEKILKDNPKITEIEASNHLLEKMMLLNKIHILTKEIN